jgi:CRP/FNR family transcriptional regulator, cyclic AMP receptor protein
MPVSPSARSRWSLRRTDPLASVAGTSRPTVNKVLGEKQEHGVLALSRGRTTLIDPAALERRARGVVVT